MIPLCIESSFGGNLSRVVSVESWLPTPQQRRRPWIWILGVYGKPGGGPGRLENTWSWKLLAHWWPFSYTAELLTFLAYCLERTVSCLLEILDLVGIICLCYFKKKKNLKCTFWKKNELIFGLFCVFFSLIENSVWRPIFNPLPFPLVLNWNIAFQAFQKKQQKNEIFYYYSIFICSLIILDFLSIWNQRKITV